MGMGMCLTSSTFVLDLALVSKNRIPCSRASCGMEGEEERWVKGGSPLESNFASAWPSP